MNDIMNVIIGESLHAESYSNDKFSALAPLAVVDET